MQNKIKIIWNILINEAIEKRKNKRFDIPTDSPVKLALPDDYFTSNDERMLCCLQRIDHLFEPEKTLNDHEITHERGKLQRKRLPMPT